MIKARADEMIEIALSAGFMTGFLSLQTLSRAVIALLLAVLAACSSGPKGVAFENPVFPPPPADPRFVYERTLTGSGDVVIETGKDKFRRFATGESRRGIGFSKPFGIAVDRGRLYVSDTVSRHVHMLDLVAHRYAEIGVKGNGRLTKPLGIALDEQGRVYVCDGSARRIAVFSSEGEFLTAVGDDDLLLRPSGVTVSKDGSKIYVVDTGGVSNDSHRVRVFSYEGAHLGDIGRRGAGDGEFNLPLAVHLAPDSLLHVLDTGNFRVQSFDQQSKMVNAFGRPGRYAGQFSHAKSLTTDLDGRIYVADTGFGVVQVFTPDGRVLMSIGNRSETPGPANFILPAGVAVDVDGRVYVVDQFYAKVDVFRPAFLPRDWPIGAPYHSAPGMGFENEPATRTN